MSEQAKAAKREYYKRYRESHKDKVNEYQRNWKRNNPDKVKAAQDRYWDKIAQRDEGSCAV